MHGSRGSVHPLHFTDEESFGLFVQGLRSLQQYEDAAATERPLKDELDRTMQSALRSFRDCTSRFSSDLLPFFYLGVTLSMKNQDAYVDRLVELTAELTAFGRSLAFEDEAKVLEIIPPRESDKTQREAKRDFAKKHAHEQKNFAQPFFDLAHRSWPLLEASSRLFQSLTDNPANPVPQDLQRVARYNLAQVLARRGSQEGKESSYLADALRAVEDQSLEDIAKLESDAKHKENKYREFSQLPKSVWKRNWPPAREKREQELKTLRREIRSIYETIALIFQFRALRETLKLRIAALDPGPSLALAAHAVESVKEEIQKTRLFDPSFKADLLADFLTKTGYAKYEFASNRHLQQYVATDHHTAKALKVVHTSSPNASFFMAQAATDLTMALELKEYWNPAQIYLALVRRIQAGMSEALSDLAKYDKASALADDVKEKARAEHDIEDSSAQESKAAQNKDSAEMKEFGSKKLKHLERLDEITARMGITSIKHDRQIADHDREAKRCANEADALFRSLRGFPSPAPASTQANPDSSVTAKPASDSSATSSGKPKAATG